MSHPVPLERRERTMQIMIVQDQEKKLGIKFGINPADLAPLKKKYGLAPVGYLWLLDLQNGVCAICGKPPGSSRLAVDHEHDTGFVRGLIHRKCNTAIGMLGDTHAGVLRAAEYLSA